MTFTFIIMHTFFLIIHDMGVHDMSVNDMNDILNVYMFVRFIMHNNYYVCVHVDCTCTFIIYIFFIILHLKYAFMFHKIINLLFGIAS